MDLGLLFTTYQYRNIRSFNKYYFCFLSRILKNGITDDVSSGEGRVCPTFDYCNWRRPKGIPARRNTEGISSLKSGGCSCSKNSLVRGSLEPRSSWLLYSAALSMPFIKLKEGEKKHEVVVELLRLAITLKAEASASSGHGRYCKASCAGAHTM